MQGLGLEDGCIAEFRAGSMKDEVVSLSVREGKKLYPDLPESTFKGVPTFREAVMVEIRIPGNKDEIIDTEAWLDKTNPYSHINRFPQAYQRFLAKEAAGPQGFPLSEWAGATRAQVDNLAYLNIKTVEQLASVADDLVGRVMGGLDLRRKAQAWLEQQTGPDALRAELDALKAQIAALSKSAPSPAHVRVVPEAAASVVANMLAPEASAEGSAAPPEAAKRRRGRPPRSATAGA